MTPSFPTRRSSVLVADRGGRREEGDQGTDVHDRAIAARHKRRQRGLHAEKHAGLVDRNDPVPPFDRLVLDAGVMDDTGSVRERGERTEGGEGGGDRSEEHTSELQSLMRISYAVFCLKKKKSTSSKKP